MKRAQLAVGGAAVAVALAATIAVVAAQGSDAPTYGTWAPGTSAPISATATIPAATSPPAALAADVATSISAMGGNAQAATHSLRLLRSALGATRSDLYAYSPQDGVWCLFLWERQSVCPTASESTTPGAVYLLSPGGPGYVGQSDDVPAAVAGIVADNIREVQLTDGSTSTELPIKNNAFYQDLNETSQGEFTIGLSFTYADGSVSEASLHGSGPFHLP